MIRIIGETCLWLALIFSFIQALLPLWGYYRNNSYALSFARPSAYGQCFFILSAYLLITIAFGISDFSILYVATNSHPSLPLMYRLTAVWGAHEGSILLWIVILNLWTMAFVFFSKKMKMDILEKTLTLSILGWISSGFLVFLLLTSNPFVAATTLQSGRDLNPLLQDPGFIIHPPMLYAGYVGFSVAFAITQAALMRNKLDYAWAHITRCFALGAWCFLTFGIMLGSWWAYRVLGWGGFWFWDPVENASLLPWLSGVALIHILVLCEKTNAAKAWAALLSITCFGLSLLGTFLVRSGVLISVHTFANDPARGLFLLILLAVLITIALSFYIARLSKLEKSTVKFSLLSREMALLFNSALLFLAMCTILLGTLYPLILDAFHLGTISVGAPYFNQVMMPFAIVIIFFMACVWSGFRKKCLRQPSGMLIAHTGFVILIIGILFSSFLNQERSVRIKPGDSTRIGPYQFNFLNTKGIQESNYRGIQAQFEVIKNRHHVTNLYPEKRIYTVRDMVMTKVDIHPGIFRDLYIALGEPLNDNDWSVRIYYKPFIRWIWLGGIVMMVGGIVAIRQKKSRKENSL